MKKVSVIVVAAGEGKRFGSPKQSFLLKGKSILNWTLEKFEAHNEVREIVLVLRDETRGVEYSEKYRKIIGIAQGGEKRQDSVLSGLNLIDPKKAEVVLIHDGVRPLVGTDLISRIIRAVKEKGAAIPVLPIEDTIKLVHQQEVSRTLDRENLFRVQTPQGFIYPVLKQALEKAKEENFYGTDEASLIERTGRKVAVVQGDPKNIKITTPEDIRIAEVLLED
jgi:2-C-methyl-D-erythritol 4-phosphate cytidylyltransferase